MMQRLMISAVTMLLAGTAIGQPRSDGFNQTRCDGFEFHGQCYKEAPDGQWFYDGPSINNSQFDKILAAKTDAEFCKLFTEPKLISPGRKIALIAHCNAVFTRCAQRHPSKSGEAYSTCLAKGTPDGRGWVVE